jgi:hypothetical protein
MPVLNVLEPSSPIIHRNRKCSEDITRHESTSSVKKRIFSISTSADNDFCNSCFLGFTFSVDVNGRGFVSFIGPIFCERFSVDFFK